MAIVKAYFTRSSEKIKKTLNYIVHRPGREGEKLNRELFGDMEESIRKEDAYRLIDASAGMTFFHLKLNFHPEREDTRKDLNLRDITRQSMVALEERLQRPIRFLAVEHNDHTDLRHIHAIMLVKLRRGERIGIEDWKALPGDGNRTGEPYSEEPLMLLCGCKKTGNRGGLICPHEPVL